MNVKSTTLDNGMTVLTHHMPHLESSSLGIWVKAGSRWERPGEHGISHLLEHMAFKGTKTRSSRQIAEQIEQVGGELNAATSIEHTGYFARVLKDDVPLAADILSDILCNSVFDPDELAREQRVVQQ
ncbi:Mitochondrial processing peptidase-like protein, partial [hydrothermal vent metagenome]